MRNSITRTSIALFRLITALSLVAVLVIMPGVSHVAAQDDGQPLAYGQNQPGEITAAGPSVFYFDAQAGDIAEITVLGFGLAPAIQVWNADRSEMLAEQGNPDATESVELSYSVSNAGRYYVLVSGLGGATGNFAISLNRGERELPPGTPLQAGTPLQGTFEDAETPLVYDFTTSPDNILGLEIRSLTGGYTPVVTLMTADGETLFSLSNPRLVGFTLLLAPGNEDLKLVVDSGDFEGPATVEVSLGGGPAPQATQEPSDGGSSSGSSGSSSGDDNTIGLTSAPSSGCYISVNQNVNIRSGGSTGHGIIAVLGADKYLSVTGYNSSNDGWYEVSLPDGRTGWIASFVATTGGPCDNLPNATYPGAGGGGTQATPTATSEGTTAPTPTDGGPTATPTTSAQIAPPDSDQNTTLDYRGDTVTLTGTISYPEGDTTDRVFYTVTGFSQVEPSGEVQLTITCSGTGVEHVRVNFNNVGSVGPSSCNSSTTKFFTDDSDQGFFRIDLVGGEGSYVNWTLTLQGLG